MLVEFDNNTIRGQIKGYLFELAIVYLLKNNGFNLIEGNDRKYIRRNSNNVIEMKGRGTWHQIDCPFDYNIITPFLFPLRLIGEVKFYSKAIHKEKIREFIGVIKDIQENYIVDEQNKENYNMLKPRYIEAGVYFSANGFQHEAENLAYAHGIKTISYLNNPVIKEIKDNIVDLEQSAINAKNRKKYFEYLKHRLLQMDSSNTNSNIFMKSEKIYIENYINSVKSIVTNFVATNDTGVLFHFISKDQYPFNLFENTDEQECRVRYKRIDDKNTIFWIEFTNDEQAGKFYFTPPKELENAASLGGNEIVDEKKRIFNKLSLNLKIHGIQRNLVLKIDKKWLNQIKDNL